MTNDNSKLRIMMVIRDDGMLDRLSMARRKNGEWREVTDPPSVEYKDGLKRIAKAATLIGKMVAQLDPAAVVAKVNAQPIAPPRRRTGRRRR